MTISLEQARQLFLTSQGLGNSYPGINGSSQLMSQIENLGYVQIDTLSVIARAHHHTLWSRQEDYEESHLSKLLKEKKVFEYWSHAASFLPISEYRFTLFRKKMYASGKIHWFREDNPKIVEAILFKVLGELQAENLLDANDEDGGYTFHGRISA